MGVGRMKKGFKWFFIALIVTGAVVSYFSTIPLVDYLAIATSMGSAGILCADTLKKVEKRTWKEYVATICIGAGSFGAGFCGVAPDTTSQIISLIVSAILLIAGLFISKQSK